MTMTGVKCLFFWIRVLFIYWTDFSVWLSNFSTLRVRLMSRGRELVRGRRFFPFFLLLSYKLKSLLVPIITSLREDYRNYKTQFFLCGRRFDFQFLLRSLSIFFLTKCFRKILTFSLRRCLLIFLTIRSSHRTHSNLVNVIITVVVVPIRWKNSWRVFGSSSLVLLSSN